MNIIHYVTSIDLGTQSKIDLILTALGHTPTAEIRFYKGNSSPKRVAHSLRMANLHVIEVKPSSKAKHISILCVGQLKLNTESLASLVTFRENQNGGGRKKDATFHALYGILMGYPMTAIDAFVRRRNIQLDELPQEFDGHPLFRFMPSVNHWRNELAVIEDWKHIITELAPHLLKKLQPIN